MKARYFQILHPKRIEGGDKVIKFFIPGIPVPKGRPRFSTFGGRMTTYTPKNTRVWEEYVKWQAIPHRPDKPLEGPLIIKMIFEMPRPKSLLQKIFFHIKKPDIDNLQKSMIDALEKAAIFKNDSQFVFKISTKRYAEVTGVYVIIEEMTTDYFADLIKKLF